MAGQRRLVTLDRSHTRRQFLAGGASLVAWSAAGSPRATAATLIASADVVGRPVTALDTPALCVDLDLLERNLATMQRRLAELKVASRPHAKTHKCPAIGRLQLASGAIGLCAAKVAEAEVFVEHGIDRVLMTTANLTPAKIRRAMALRRRSRHFIQAVDHPQNARDLSEAAREAGVQADVVVDVAVGTRTGVPPDDRALALARLVDTLPNLRLRGLISYDGGAQHIKGYAARREQTLSRFAASVTVADAMRKAGLSTEIFSGGGTGTYDIMPAVAGLTDVQVGSYVFMDCQYIEIGSASGERFEDFAPSLTVRTTVLNTYFPGSITTDAGTKALTLNKPGPWVIGEPDLAYTATSDEFGIVRFDAASARRQYRPGDQLELIVPHCDPVVNEFDVIHATRNGRVEAVWPIAARGRSQ